MMITIVINTIVIIGVTRQRTTNTESATRKIISLAMINAVLAISVTAITQRNGHAGNTVEDNDKLVEIVMKPWIKDSFVATIISVVMCGFLSTAATAQQEQPVHERVTVHRVEIELNDC